MKSGDQRLIEAAESQAPGEQPPIVLLWEEYKALVAERDAAQALARGYREQWDDLRKDHEVTTEHLRVAQGRIEIYVGERDAARAAAAACYAWATGGYGAGSPAGLFDALVRILGVEDYTKLPGWLTERRLR